MSLHEPGLAESLARGLDPCERVHCWQVTWLEADRWRTERYADSDDAIRRSVLLGSKSMPIVVGSSAERRYVYPSILYCVCGHAAHAHPYQSGPGMTWWDGCLAAGCECSAYREAQR